MIRSRLENKIFLLLSGVLIVAFGIYLPIIIRNESETLLAQHREKSKAYTETLMTGIRNVMLTGKGSFARSLVNEAREKLTFGRLLIYNRDGKEVFVREGEGMVESEKNAFVMKALESGTPVVDYHGLGLNGITRYEPLYNLSACQACHGKDHLVRGVMKLSLGAGLFEYRSIDSVGLALASSIGSTLASGFRTIMISGEGKLIDTLVRQGPQIPVLESFQVYNRFGRIRFGDSSSVLPARIIRGVIGNREPVTVRSDGNTLVRLIPMKNEERCQLCHLEDHEWRGVLAAAVNVDAVRQRGRSAEVLAANFGNALSAVFRSIMLVGKGGYVRTFIDDMRTHPFVRGLSVFDRFGNERFVTEEPKNRSIVSEVLKSPRDVEFQEASEGGSHLVMLTPLLNDVQCQKCHGPNHQVRAVVEVSSSMAPINAAIRENAIRTAIFGLSTLLFVAVLLHQFMKKVVVRPIGIIGRVASRVGEGDLTVRADVVTKDEIGQLARQINDMIRGLRERFHLERFVSRGAIEAVKQSDVHGVKLGGERLTVTVMFSDIRGFTSLAEKVEPETVVTMLNESLSQQARIVKRHGGDIDKFVGDELVAVFIGEEMVDRALGCALEIQREVQVHATGGKVGIGIGINAGPVVMGAMGSEERMDFTVVGDTVNLGARLCSTAAAGQVLVSANALSLVKHLENFVATSLEPLLVKGKEKPVEVFEVHGVRENGMN